MDLGGAQEHDRGQVWANPPSPPQKNAGEQKIQNRTRHFQKKQSTTSGLSEVLSGVRDHLVHVLKRVPPVRSSTKHSHPSDPSVAQETPAIYPRCGQENGSVSASNPTCD